MPLAAYNDNVWNTSFLFDSLGFYSSMDDIFTRLLTLASYISRRLIQFIENLAVRDADRYSDDLLVISAGKHIRSLRHGICKSFSEGCSSSSKPCNPETCERRASKPTEDTRSEILSFIFAFVSLEFRVQKTLQGSYDDIGWLPRFLELFAGIRNGEHTLPSSFVHLLIPGLYSNHGPVYFVGTKKFFSKMGLACHIAKIHGEASVEHNAWELKQDIEELY
ncbi:uncharacterized protein Pyn_15427 [Prunus yedoensis var. nudiflora]|uniref:Uncharacterized protein n=1 Tax=Prunus yedoensis var. nudiflora TaxID=2094558 RepID=A0A314YVF3_PRUYE|nr:uncharacterized protein Pyn_15427 [Prunus yedoensis var. nudiflora]